MTMNHGLVWHLEVIDWDAIRNKKYGGDIICNTKVDNFFTLAEAFEFIGFRLPKQRNGYSGLRGSKEYRLTKNHYM